MTIKTICNMKQNAYRQHSERWARIRRAAYPETGGTGLFIHNWYACSRDAADMPELASIIANSGEWASWHRIEDRLQRWFDASEHRDHVRKSFTPLWCNHCQQPTVAQ